MNQESKTILKADFDHLVGLEVGTSTLLRELARGGMAVLFVAFQRTLKRQIAVKILPKSQMTPEAAAGFRQEAETSAILSHPNIVPIYEVGETNDFLFFTMQLIQGRPLSYHIARVRRHVIPSKRFLPLDMTLDIVLRVLDALDHAHRQDIVHRDVKPANILIEKESGRPLITDFGIANLTRDLGSRSRAIQGTPIYMAPEQIVTIDLDGRADVYATGVLLFEMLVSRLPLPPHESKRELMKKKLEMKDDYFQNRPSRLNPSVDEELDAIVMKAAAFRPDDRFAGCREFINHLKDYRDRMFRGDI
ncbi:MAG: serine/threonine protein kinase [Deltaproteobacteria bacterium]|nr:serine/threonine protein kinase [Deltaproteobacteria bacterium]